MRYPEKATPIIVVGRPRTGTRFLAGALNKFPEITIQGELPNSVMKRLVMFVDYTESYYRQAADEGDASRKEAYEMWLEKKSELLFSMWTNAGKGRVVRPRKGCRYFGYKRPDHEMHFDFYEEHFRKRKPVYIYCARNFVDNYLSISARWPERRISQVADEYVASVRQYRKMRAVAPERVFKFVLDEHIRYGAEYVETNILRRLDIELAPTIVAAVANMSAKNTAAGLNVERRTALTAKEERYIRKRPELRNEFESLLG